MRYCERVPNFIDVYKFTCMCNFSAFWKNDEKEKTGPDETWESIL